VGLRPGHLVPAHDCGEVALDVRDPKHVTGLVPTAGRHRRDPAAREGFQGGRDARVQAHAAIDDRPKVLIIPVRELLDDGSLHPAEELHLPLHGHPDKRP